MISRQMSGRTSLPYSNDEPLLHDNEVLSWQGSGTNISTNVILQMEMLCLRRPLEGITLQRISLSPFQFIGPGV